MQISGHKNVAFINNYSTLSEERHKKISNFLSNTESETNRNAFQQTYLVKPPQILQPVALLMFRVEAIPIRGGFRWGRAGRAPLKFAKHMLYNVN